MPVKRLLTVGLVTLSLVVSSCALIEEDVDEWTLDAFTDLVAFCERGVPSPAACPGFIQLARDDFNCTVEETYLVIGQIMALINEPGPLDSAAAVEGAREVCDPSTP